MKADDGLSDLSLDVQDLADQEQMM